MAKKARPNYRQQYSTNGINSPSAGRTGQTAKGRFNGATQGFSEESGGKVSRNGRMLTRRQRDYQVRKGIRDWELQNGRRYGTLPGEGGGAGFQALSAG